MTRSQTNLVPMFHSLTFQTSHVNLKIFEKTEDFEDWYENIIKWANKNGYGEILKLEDESAIDDSNRLKINQLKYIICQWLSPIIRKVVQHLLLPSQILQELKNRFEPCSNFKIGEVFEEFCQLKMKSGENLEVFFRKFDAKYEYLKKEGLSLPMQILVYKLLHFLPSEYTKIRQEILENSDGTSITLTEVKNKLRLHSKAVSQSRKDFKKDGKSRILKTIICFKCGRQGHLAKNCRFKR